LEIRTEIYDEPLFTTAFPWLFTRPRVTENVLRLCDPGTY